MTNKIIWVLIFFGLIDATEAKQSNESPLREPITASSGAKELILIVGPDTNRISAIDLKATRYRKTGDFDAAIAEYRKIIKLYEQSALKVDVKNSLIIHYIRKIAACYKGKKDFDSAIKEYLSMMALAKAYSWQETAELAVLAVIESALQSGQYDQEVTGYEENVLSEVQNESTLLTLAYLYRKYRRYNRAIAEYRKFIRKYPKSRYIGDARYSLGSCYLARAQESTSSDEFFRNYEAALAEFKAALDYSTYDINRLDQTINSIINCYITLNRKKALDRFLSDYREKFLSNCRRVIVERANTPDAALAQYYIGRFWFRENKYDQAIEEFSRVLNMGPYRTIQAMAHIGIAWALMGQGHYSDAIQEYQNAINTNPEAQVLDDAQLGMAYAYYLLGDQVTARKVLREMIDVHHISGAAQKASLMLELMDQLK